MDRRSFVTSVLLSVGILTVTLGAANALPAVAPLDHVAPADDGNIRNRLVASPRVVASPLALAPPALR